MDAYDFTPYDFPTSSSQWRSPLDPIITAKVPKPSGRTRPNVVTAFFQKLRNPASDPKPPRTSRNHDIYPHDRETYWNQPSPKRWSLGDVQEGLERERAHEQAYHRRPRLNSMPTTEDEFDLIYPRGPHSPHHRVAQRPLSILKGRNSKSLRQRDARARSTQDGGRPKLRLKIQVDKNWSRSLARAYVGESKRRRSATSRHQTQSSQPKNGGRPKLRLIIEANDDLLRSLARAYAGETRPVRRSTTASGTQCTRVAHIIR
ncbi:hypothetical protein FA95DRAFT_1654927 [Auriscalpium vulgare]|uniref:Uncharacterized protein n=1 Tax=Auriscalpium vulgare TaxID=40419 RepID=A0ACB8RYI1_9AGAM|nr:hypothetical protein FA95DRAFT_1654927 [Auriscalpium vulgare]